MTFILRILCSFIIALAASYMIGLTGATPESGLSLPILAIVFLACIITAFVSPALRRIPLPSIPTPGNSAREQGQIKWFNVNKGYGFITRDNGDDVFVHFRSIRGNGRRQLKDGQPVEFIVVSGEKGPQAEEVEVL